MLQSGRCQGSPEEGVSVGGAGEVLEGSPGEVMCKLDLGRWGGVCELREGSPCRSRVCKRSERKI